MNNEKEEFRVSNSEKIANWIKNNAYNFVIVITCVAFLFKDFAEISKTNKEWYEILADSFLYLVMGVTLTTLMGKKGIMAGMEDSLYLATKKSYGEEIEEITPYLDRIDSFCDRKNELELIRRQTRMLRRIRVKYEDFISPNFDITIYSNKDRKYIDKVQNVSIRYLTYDNLLSEDTDKIERGKKDISVSTFEKVEISKNMSTKVICALVFGLFTLTMKEDFSYASLIWSGIQVSMWLCMATLQYFTNYNWVKNNHRQAIIRKINYLDEFHNSVIKNPNIYKSTMPTTEIVEESEEKENGNNKETCNNNEEN